MSTPKAIIEIPVEADLAKYLPGSEGLNLGGWYARVVEGFPLGGLIAFGDGFAAAREAVGQALIEAIDNGGLGDITPDDMPAIDGVRLRVITGKTIWRKDA